MKICFLSTMSGAPWGGSEFLWYEAAKCALKQTHEVLTATGQWDPLPGAIEHLAALGATRVLFPPSKPSLTRRIFRKVARQFLPLLTERSWREISDWRPEFLCISQGSAFDGVFREDIARFLDKSQLPYGIICHHHFERIIINDEAGRTKAANYFGRARWVGFVAEGNRLNTERELGVRIPNSVLLKNPVNLKDTAFVPWPQGRTLRFACVARLEASFKGQDLLLEVLSANCWKDREWELRLFGAGLDRAYLDRLITMYRLESRVKFAGHVDDIRGIWAQNHLLVLPSRSEGTPLSLVEAMVCGRPAVVTDVGGNSEWVTDSVTGFVAEGPTVRSLSGALERAWQANERWESIGETAHKEALSRLDHDPGGTLLDLIERPAHAVPICQTS